MSKNREQRLRALGGELLERARTIQVDRGAGERWTQTLLEQSMGNPAFRTRALRFVDVLPALTDDQDLVTHMKEYFSDGELPLPGLARWGVDGAGMAPSLAAGAVRKAMGAMARRFLGGADVEDALVTVEALAGQGADASLDRLGEAVVSEAEADAYLAACRESVTRLPEGVNLSLKVSSLAPHLTPRAREAGVASVLRRLRTLVDEVRRRGLSLCLDMEQYDLKAITFGVLRGLLEDPGLADWPGAGIAVQAYLRQARADLEALLEWQARRGSPITVRLVRGAYWDQETVLARRERWPIPVWGHKAATDRSFEDCLERLFLAAPGVRPAVASHNLRSVALAMVLAEESGLSNTEFEFQMLYGMGEALRQAVLDMGYRVRVYVPFGALLPGMAYLVRRLLENSSSQSFLRMGHVPAGDPGILLAPPREEPGPSLTVPAGFHNTPVHRFTDEAERAAFTAVLDRVRGSMDREYPLLIGGERLQGQGILRSINPARPGERVGRVAVAGKVEAEAAVKAALQAFPDWRDAGAQTRAALLRRAAEALTDQRDEFAAWEVFEAGKTWPEADADVTEAIDYLNYYADEALRLDHGNSMDVPGETNRYGYAPRGVAVILPPWNFPLAIPTGMLSAALVTGNTAILKPSSQTPVVAARLVDLLHRCGFPPGAVNYLPGPGAEVGEYLVTHPAIHLVAFTGSMEVGTRICRLAAEVRPGQGHVKRLVAEMGGKNAVIVDSDADLDDAVPGIAASAFGYQGQKCSACSRVIVVGAVYQTFLERFSEAVASLRAGTPEDPATDLGPVIEESARARIEATIAEATKNARLVLRTDLEYLRPGFYVGPALFTDVDPQSTLAQEEVFGPVLAVLRARDFGQALVLANGTRYALTGGVYTRSPGHMERARREFQVGNLYLNRGITGAVVGRQPFGGFRLSGVGSKAGGPDYLLQFTEPRTVTENTLRRGFAPEL